MSITTEQFEYVASLVKSRAAIVVNEGKEYLVTTRLEPIARSLGFESLGLMIDDMARTSGFGEVHKLTVEALTTNETYFFRDMHPFDALEKKIIPEAIARRSAERKLDIWSGASSTGQEAYSIAMMLLEKFPELIGWQVRILGTDLSEQAVNKAKRGAYSQIEVNRGLPLPLLVKYFANEDREWVLKPEVRRWVEFRTMNLIEPWRGLPRFDVILMRNVLIYFDIETRRQILSNVRNTLHRDGALVLGAAETTFQVDNSWSVESVGRTHVYRQKPDGDRKSQLAV